MIHEENSVDQLISRLRTYNAWRRGAENEMPDPQQIGQDIDAAIVALEEYEKLKKRYAETYNQNLDMLSVLKHYRLKLFYVKGYDHAAPSGTEGKYE
jgi:hypothetical protein